MALTQVTGAQIGPLDLTIEVSGILPVANGGTGSATKNFVDLTTGQTVAGDKILTGSTILGGTASTTNGAVYHNIGLSNQFFGIYDSLNARWFGISRGLPAPANTSTLGGYYSGLGVGGASSGGGNPIFGVLNSVQSSNGIGQTALTVYDSNKVVTFNHTLDDGSGLATLINAKLTTPTNTTTSVVTVDGTQTLSNKTEASPVLSGSVTGTYTLAGTPTITNPTINGGTFNNLGGKAAITADTAAINTTETVVTTATVPTAVVGTTYRITLLGTCTASAANASTFTIRAGTAGTTADASIATVAITSATAGTAVPFQIVLLFTCRTTGATGTVAGSLVLNNTGVTGIETRHSVVVALTGTSTLNTTTATKLTATYKTAATTTTSTFTGGIIEIVKP